MKIWFTNAVLLGASASKENLEILEKLKTATGAQAKSLGAKIKDLSTATWDRDSSGVMKNILTLSFEQNPNALAKLLATGNATLTHTQDKTKWGKEFPRLLMEVRQELSAKSKSPAVIEDTQVDGTIEGTDYKAEIYTSQFIDNWSQAESMLTKNPNNIYLYDAPLKQEPAKTGRTGNQKLHGLANNAVGITTKMSYSMETGKVRSDIVRDVDGKINLDIKNAIDANIENIRAHIAQGQEVRFDAAGYGQEMLESDKNGNQYAPQTFVYLSEQLYKNFGFVNPNYLSNSVNNAVVKESVARLQETQDITDKEINRTIDDYSNHDVLEFMKNCM